MSLVNHMVHSSRTFYYVCQFSHHFSTHKYAFEDPISLNHKVDSWQIHSYGDLKELQLTKARSPVITKPTEVVVQVAAASVNPIDIAMVGGYGSVMFNLLRQAEACSLQNILEFPLTLGRDFSGYVIEKGHSVDNNFKIGDEVWGVVPVHQQGSHSRTVLVDQAYIHKRPKSISLEEAGSILYAAVTAWSALKITSGLAVVPARGKSVLVLGGSGGVGSMAVQMLRSWGAHVVATCRTDAVPYLESLGVPVIIDYTKEDADSLIKQEGRYDIILDCAGLGEEGTSKYVSVLKEFNFSKLVTLKSPLLKNVDNYGVVAGMFKNAGDLLMANFTAGIQTKLSSVRWGFFIPVQRSLKEITFEVESGKLLPCIDSAFNFKETPAAYKRVADGHLRGKVLIDFGFTKTS